MDLLRGHLDNLRITNLPEWDVLAFIYVHGTNLASAEQIARLLGHRRAAVSDALDSLTSTGLVQRSRDLKGVRLYQLAPAVEGDSRWHSQEELIRITGDRNGRLALIGHLRQAGGREAWHEHGGLHLA